ncbi:MAG: hypothetical protein Q7T14_01920 [Aestuariivirga sp.]|nr:hypothetical protein [Aestuariivirga sp.]
MTDISNIAIERRAKENFQRANLKDRTWGDQMVEREPGKKIPVALSDQEREVYLKQANDDLLAEQNQS